MKTLASILLGCALATGAFAGTAVSYSSKSSKNISVPPALGCDCFAPGAAIGIYGAYIDNESGGNEEDAWGGGVLGEYFFTDMIGVQGSYSLLATDSEHHEFDAALVVRFPITSICLAPYIMGGGGYASDSYNAWNIFAGAGFEVRIPDVNCLGIFADGAYHWSEDDGNDFWLFRAGIKFPL
jgi:hypothetical protein